jgi:hypothetical protein
MKTRFIKSKLSEVQIGGIGPLEPSLYSKVLDKFISGEEITFVNIICPGYKKERERGVEEFNFSGLSRKVPECPNVILMLEKMINLVKLINKLGFSGNVNTKLILADVAIFNYKELSEKQNIKETMDSFYGSIRKYMIAYNEVELAKMSDLPFEFERIPLFGVKPKTAESLYKKARSGICKKANEYIGSLVFERINQLMSEGVYSQTRKKKIIDNSKKEVMRFLAEYGLAGLAIRKMYRNPVVLFTEPSGYIRGYFYNALLEKKNKLPVLYLC